MSQLDASATQNEQSLLPMDLLLGQLLHTVGVHWFFNLVYERNFFATTTQVAYAFAPSQGIVTADLITHFFFGVPRSVSTGPMIIDADTDVIAAGELDGSTGQRSKAFAMLAGMSGSSWEHMVLEGFFDSPGVSSMKLLRAAVDQGIPIHKIDSSNIGQILPLLSLAPEDINDIQNAIATGKEVTVSQTEVQVDNYRGIGLLILDPQKGDGLYLISGGLAGGYTFSLEEWNQDVYNHPFVTIIARSLVFGWAKAIRYTPYSLGCKDPVFGGEGGTDLEGNRYCDSSQGIAKRQAGGIDCSGLVSWSYEMVGFPFFAEPRQLNAQGQYNFVNTNFPAPTTIRLGDLIFFENTYDKNGNKIRTDDGVTHVGIVINLERWIAAESTMVDFYCSPSFKQNNPTDDCKESTLWDKFYEYGSVFGR